MIYVPKALLDKVSLNATIAFDAGGGGSGGHTILDDEGTSLTQRNDLQFKGAYSVDNSTDQITEVNVVREMTKAEFDLLTADEKVGIINVTDTTSSGDNEFQPIIYSEEEREIGVWTDGKPLYAKTFNKSVTCGSEQTTIDTNDIPNLDTIVYMEGNYANLALNYYDSSNYRSYTFAENTNHQLTSFVKFGSISSVNSRFTLYYTKTTDTPGSGTWTPQGVPAVHYSTTEQVVGTWIDGKPLYQLTCVGGAVSAGQQGSVDLTDYSIDTFVGVDSGASMFIRANYNDVGYSLNGNELQDSQWGILVNGSPSALTVNTRNFGLSSWFATIRYTKAST